MPEQPMMDAKGRTLVDMRHEFNVPPEVAVCPYCGLRLVATCEHWSQQADGSWIAGGLEVDCVGEPENLHSDDYNDWLSRHTYMPYIYWLPVNEKVTRWVNRHFRFRMKDHPHA